jgi:hypothetical protein
MPQSVAQSSPASQAASVPLGASPDSASGADALPVSGPIEPGSHTVTKPFPLTFDLTVGDDWGVYGRDDCCVLFEHHHFEPPGLVGFGAWTIDAVYADPCKHTLGPTLGPGADALVEALLAIPGTNPGAPKETTVDGRRAVRLELQPADGVDPSTCVNDEFALWAWKGEETRYVPPGYPHPVDDVWILDVDGTRIVLESILSDPSDADRAVGEAVTASVRFR